MLKKWVLPCLALLLLSCGDERDVLRVSPEADLVVDDLSQLSNDSVNRLLKESLFLLPATSTAELQARALVSYLGGAFERGKPQSLSIAGVLEEGKTTPYVAVALAYHAAKALLWEPRVLVLDCAPGAVWFLEVNTEDGRFLLDPYHRALATPGAPFAQPLPYPTAFSEGTWYAAGGDWPPDHFEQFLASWHPEPVTLTARRKAAYDTACARGFYDARRSVAFPITVDMTTPSRQWGTDDDSPWDLDGLFAAEGDVRSDHAFLGAFFSPAGPVVIAHQLELQALVPGKSYRYTYEEADTTGRGYLLALPVGIRLGDWVERGDRLWSVDFKAEGKTATLQLGFGNAGRMALDWFSITELP